MNDPRSDIPVGEELERALSHPGLRLAQAREDKHLGVEFVASRLNIPSRYVLALECGDYDKLPGLAYARGYIRAYAKLLGLSPDTLINEFNLLYSASEQPRPVTSINKVGQQVKLGDAPIRFSLWLFVIVLAGISLWWWQTQSTTTFLPQSLSSRVGDIEKPVAPPRVDVTANIIARTAEVVPPIAEALPGQTEQDAPVIEAEPSYLSDEEVAELARRMESEPVSPSDVGQQDSTAVPPSDAMVRLKQSAPLDAPGSVSATAARSTEFAPDNVVVAPAKAVVLSRLVIEFNDDCWVTVRDASDKPLFSGMKRAGQTLDLQLETPGKLLVGRVSSVVRAEFDGELLDLRAIAKKDVAKISLP